MPTAISIWAAILTIYHCDSNKAISSEFPVVYRERQKACLMAHQPPLVIWCQNLFWSAVVRQKTPEEGRKVQRRKCREKHNQDEYVVPSISFHTFFVQLFKIVVDSWTFSMLLLYIVWDDWPIFMISGSNQQLQQQLEYTLLKPDCHSWWISKMQSGRDDTLEERYTIKFCFKLGKNDATETYRMLQTAFRPTCMNRASVFEWHKRFKESRESVRDDKWCGRSQKVYRPELIGQRFRVRVTMLRF